MRLVAIISAWADTKELLPFCIDNLSPVVNKIIVVYSYLSSHGNYNDGLKDQVNTKDCIWSNYEPESGLSTHENETRKRNHGINIARQQGFTHFLIADADEFYKQDEFLREKTRIEENNLNGLVCRLKVYIKEPTLCCDDHTLVPFIQKLKPETMVGNYKKYPFTMDSEGHAHIDPTRRVNHYDRVEMSDIYMHHYSYIRKDMDIKIRNSSAKLENSRRS